METPDLSHFSSSDYERIYEPAEDSFLLLDALEADLDWLTGEGKPWLCVEVGSGSGVIISAIAALPHRPVCLAIDKDPFACSATVKTAKNSIVLPVVTDLTSALRVEGRIDLLVFNPPYVPTPDEEVDDGDKRRWAGGKRGRKVIDRFLPSVKNLLSPGGRFYLLVVLENDPDEICDFLSREGMSAGVILSRRCGAERLSVIRAVKPPH